MVNKKILLPVTQHVGIIEQQKLPV